MTNRLQKILLCLIFFIPQISHGQENQIIDSLKAQVNMATTDSVKVMALSELGREYIYVSPHLSYQHSLKALQLAQKLNFTRGIANAKRTLGSVNILLGNYLTAGKLLNGSLDSFQTLNDDRGIANCHLSLGLLYHRQNNFDTALEQLNRALNIYRRMGSLERIAICYNNIGEVYLDSQSFKLAKVYIDSSIVINHRIQNLLVLQANYQNLGHIAAGLNQFSDAATNYQEVLHIHAQLNNNSNINATCKSLIGLANQADTHELSIDYCKQMMELANDPGFENYQIQGHQMLYELYSSLGNLQLANQHLLDYATKMEQFTARTRNQQAQALEDIYILSAQQKEIETLKITQELKNEIISNQYKLLILAAIFVIANGIFIVALYRNNERKKRAYEILKKTNKQIIVQRDQIFKQSIEIDRQKERLHLAQLAAQLGGWEYDVQNNSLEWYTETIHVFANISDHSPTPEEYLNSLHADDRSLFLSRQKVLIKEKKPYDEVIRHMTKHGDIRHVRLIAKPVINQDKVIKVLGVSLDVSKMIEYQSKLEKSNFDKDIIQATVAHDLRSPLNNIISLKNLLKLETPAERHDNQILNMISESAERGLNLINDLLESSELQDENLQLKKEKVDFRAWLIDYYNRNQKTDQDERIVSSPGHDKIEIEIDINRINRAIENIVNNARKFTPSDGYIKLDLSKSATHAILEIKDSGIGIPKNMIPVLFDRFSKAKRQGLNGEKPHGLGMSIVKTIIDMHGGNIEVTSEENKGTKFTISLPLINAEIEKDEIRTAPA